MERFICNLFFVLFTMVVIVLYVAIKNTPNIKNEKYLNDPNQVVNTNSISQTINSKTVERTGERSLHFISDLTDVIFSENTFQLEKVSSEFVDRTLDSLIENGNRIKNTFRKEKDPS